jgi:hypothetical protein
MKLHEFRRRFQPYADLYTLEFPAESQSFGVFQANGDVEYTYLVKDAHGTVIACLRAVTSHKALHDKAEFTTFTWDDLGYALSQKTNNTYDNPAQALADAARLASFFPAMPAERTKFIPAALKLYQLAAGSPLYTLADCLTVLALTQGDYLFAVQLCEQKISLTEIMANQGLPLTQLKALYNYWPPAP